eukprot:2629471-Prymnesium_polylepis.1
MQSTVSIIAPQLERNSNGSSNLEGQARRRHGGVKVPRVGHPRRLQHGSRLPTVTGCRVSL